MPPTRTVLHNFGGEGSDAERRLAYRSWECDRDGCDEVIRFGEDNGYIVHGSEDIVRASASDPIPTYDRQYETSSAATHRVYCTGHGLHAATIRYLGGGEWTEDRPDESPFTANTINVEPLESLRSQPRPHPAEEDSMECAICGASRDDGTLLRYTNYPWRPHTGRSGRLRACSECLQNPIFQCPTCRNIFHVEDHWPDWDDPGGFPPSGLMLPCSDHSHSTETPSLPCMGCGETGVPGDVDYRDLSPMEDTDPGDEVELEPYIACRSCSRNHLWVYCEGVNCMTADSPRYFTTNDPNYDEDTRLCSDCPHEAPPSWFPEDDPADWDLRPWCVCNACDWMRRALPDTPDEATDEEGEQHPICFHCSGSFESAEGFEQVMVGEDEYENVCSTCYGGYHSCSDCGIRVSLPHGGHRVNRMVLCASCLDSSDWSQCLGRCRRWYSAGTECECGGVFRYDYAPSFSFFEAERESLNPSYTPYLGFEIEIEAPSGIPRNEGSSLAHNTDFLYPMHDGSLNNGIEIASMPISFQWLKENELQIKDVLARLASMGWRSYDTDTCGMHVHLSKEPLSKLHLLKLARMVYDYPGLCMAVGQRSRSTRGVSRFSSFQSEDLSRITKKVRDEENLGQGHYVAFNVEKRHTVEFRFFRGTLRLTSFIKNLEFVYALYEFTSKAGLRTTNESNFLSFLSNGSNINRFPHLVNFLNDNYLVNTIKEAS